MSAFHEALKHVFTEIEVFLNSTLESESLSKKAQKEKSKVVELLKKLYADYEAVDPKHGEDDESRFTSTSFHGSDEGTTTEEIPYVTVKALSGPAKNGYLLKKSNELLDLFSSKQKRYCVLHKNNFYWFKKPNDKKQQGAFCLAGYEVRETGQSDNEQAKKDFSFEVVCCGKKSHQFIAENKEDLESWKKAFAIGSSYVEPPQAIIMDFEDDGDVYEMMDGMGDPRQARMASTASPLPQLPPPPEVSDFEQPLIEEADEVYIDAVSETTSKQHSSSVAVIPQTMPNYDSDNFDDDDDSGLYEPLDAVVPPQPRDNNNTNHVPMISAALPPRGFAGGSNSNNNRDMPSPPPRPPGITASSPPPLPNRGFGIPTPPADSKLPAVPEDSPPALRKMMTRIPTLGKMVSFSGEDYENLFYGIWKCIGMTEKELSFDQGEIIHVINRDFDEESWWVGELNGKIGLVPKPFLCPAYEVMS